MAHAAGRRPLTPQQRAAVTAREVSVALSAGAGCGKTFVLTERFLSHLEPGDGSCRLEELIAITFTRRAAREMRERIRAACHTRLVTVADDGEVAHWLDLVRCMERARISTIDAFCADFLRGHAVEAGIDPAFSVLDAAQAASLMTEAIDSQLRRLLLDEDEALVSLAADFGLSNVRDLVRRLLSWGGEAIDFAAWSAITPDELVERWSAFRRDVCLPMACERLRKEPAAASAMALLESLEFSEADLREWQGDLLSDWSELGPDKLESALPKIKQLARVRGGVKGVEAALKNLGEYEPIKNGFAALRATIDDCIGKLAWNPEVARRSAEAGLKLLRVAEQAELAYAQLKQSASALDFGDLLRKTRQVLADERHAGLRSRLAADIRLLLVDEFQDTNPLQVRLIEGLCGDGVMTGRLFFVGDFKQSIYRFRGADPAVFARLRDAIPAAGRLPLSENFRSQPAILNFVNALFCDEFGEGYEPLAARRPQLTSEPAVEFLWVPRQEDASDKVGDLRQVEADWLARRLRQLLDQREPLAVDEPGADGERTARPVRPGDIAILFRALSDVAVYEAALRRYGLDYYLVGGHAFYSQQEVFDLLNLLRTLGSPADEVRLAGALRSPFFTLDDETLFWLAQHPDGVAAGLAAGGRLEQLSSEQQEAVDFARDVLAELRACKDRLSVAELIERSLSLTGYDALLLTEFLGERKLANLRKLIEQARSFDESGVCTLAEFVVQLDEFVTRQPDEALAATQPEAADVIRLMTIHQAKGLEFPVVAIPDLQRPPKAGSGIAFSAELGPLVKLPAEIETEAGASGRDLYGMIEAEEDRAEAMRVLYVAATRAADYLILSSWVKHLGDASSPWMKLLASRFDLVDGKLSVKLPAGYKAPQVRVTADMPQLMGDGSGRTSAPDIMAALRAAERSKAQRPEAAASVTPIPVDRAARRQFSFSELDGALRAGTAGDEPTSAESSIDGDRSARDAAQALGTLTHALLAEMTASPEIDLAARAEHHARLMRIADPANAALLDESVAQAVELARRLERSPRYQELQGAARKFAEIEFLLAWPPGDVTSDGVRFRGFIDCLYQDRQGHWHVLDFKTNRVAHEGVARLAAKYELQMLLYALAVEHAVGEPPASLTLSFLQPGVEHPIAFSTEIRSAAIERIDAALAAYWQGASHVGS